MSPSTRRSATRVASFGAALAIASAPAWSAPAGGHDHHAGHASPASEPVRSVTPHAFPRVSLVRQDGRKVELPADIDDGRPVFLNFIYTTCTAICPPMSMVFAAFQEALGAERDKVRLVSVSIDPEQDTPKRLDAYAKRFGAGPQWTFYTGSLEASVAVQKAFAVWRGDKMNHTPLTLVRAAPGQPWVRLDGFATPEQLLAEYRRTR
ncbi:MAG TPA: SCO family protein [Albitalea sp.]